MPKGIYKNVQLDVDIKFDFTRPSDRKLTDLWKGWYKQARKACPTLPNTFELSGTYQQYIPLREPEVTDLFIIYRLVDREDADCVAVIILSRK